VHCLGRGFELPPPLVRPDISEDRVTTVQGPQHRTTIQGAPRQYEIALQLRYKATSKQGPLYGLGQTRLIGSRNITFTPSDGLKPGMNADIAVDWPRFLDPRIHLQLVLEATIIDSQDGVAEAYLNRYYFRTCPPLVAE
jgi:hypothetical protein